MFEIEDVDISVLLQGYIMYVRKAQIEVAVKA